MSIPFDDSFSISCSLHSLSYKLFFSSSGHVITHESSGKRGSRERLKCCEYCLLHFLIQSRRAPAGTATSHLSCLYMLRAKGFYFNFSVFPGLKLAVEDEENKGCHSKVPKRGTED